MDDDFVISNSIALAVLSGLHTFLFSVLFWICLVSSNSIKPLQRKVYSDATSPIFQFINGFGALYHLCLCVHSTVNVIEGYTSFGPIGCRIQLFYVTTFVIGNSFTVTFMALVGLRAVVANAFLSHHQQNIAAGVGAILCVATAVLTTILMDDDAAAQPRSFCFPLGASRWVTIACVACLGLSTFVICQAYWTLFRQVEASTSFWSQGNGLSPSRSGRRLSESIPENSPVKSDLGHHSMDFYMKSHSVDSGMGRGSTKGSMLHIKTPTTDIHPVISVPENATPPVDASPVTPVMVRGISIGHDGAFNRETGAADNAVAAAQRGKQHVTFMHRLVMMLTLRGLAIVPIVVVCFHVWVGADVPEWLQLLVPHAISTAAIVHSLLYVTLFQSYKQKVYAAMPTWCQPKKVAPAALPLPRPRMIPYSPTSVSQRGPIIAVVPVSSSPISPLHRQLLGPTTMSLRGVNKSSKVLTGGASYSTLSVRMTSDSSNTHAMASHSVLPDHSMRGFSDSFPAALTVGASVRFVPTPTATPTALAHKEKHHGLPGAVEEV